MNLKARLLVLTYWACSSTKRVGVRSMFFNSIELLGNCSCQEAISDVKSRPFGFYFWFLLFTNATYFDLFAIHQLGGLEILHCILGKRGDVNRSFRFQMLHQRIWTHSESNFPIWTRFDISISFPLSRHYWSIRDQHLVWDVSERSRFLAVISHTIIMIEVFLNMFIIGIWQVDFAVAVPRNEIFDLLQTFSEVVTHSLILKVKGPSYEVVVLLVLVDELAGVLDLPTLAQVRL